MGTPACTTPWRRSCSSLFRRAPERYRQARSALVLTTADVGWWAGDGAGVEGASQMVNELAAMPSMHVGWALWCALVLASQAVTPDSARWPSAIR